jgi:ACS family allantoate permease-like MFS transporter
LPDNPTQAKFLGEEKRKGVILRIRDNETGIENKNFKLAQFVEAVMDLKTWLLFIFAVASNAPNGGLTTFQGIIIRGMGFPKLETTLIQMPSGGATGGLLRSLLLSF